MRRILLPAVVVAVVILPAPAAGATSTPGVIQPSPVPPIGRLAAPKILPLIFEVESLDGSEATRGEGGQTTIAISTDVLFEFGKADLTPQAATRIDGVAEKLRDVTGTATVVGHTDSVGSDAVNLPLSRQRAEAVSAALGPKVPGITLQVDGRGSADPVAPNTVDGRDNPDGRAKNRRVEITYTG